jgi:uncharacterized OB-fold protein
MVRCRKCGHHIKHHEGVCIDCFNLHIDEDVEDLKHLKASFEQGVKP